MTSEGITRRRPLVVGNWKMHGDRQSNAQRLSALVAGWQGEHPAEVVICPPYPYLTQVAEAIDGSQLILGSQSVNDQGGEGALTGEVSASMLADVGCRYAIVGHNERRRLQGETDARVAGQFLAARECGLVPILCVGESEQERDAGQTLSKIGSQLRAVLDAAGMDAFHNALVAYEPIWAVGTGVTASPEQAQEVHAFIRGELGNAGPAVRLLYGGSVRPDNAGELFAMADIDGALVGGASLKAEEFLGICQAADRAAG